MALHDRSWVRVCGQIYNTPSDYDRLAAALPELVPCNFACRRPRCLVRW